MEREVPKELIRRNRSLNQILDSARTHLSNLNVAAAHTEAELDQRVKMLVELSRDIRELSLFHSQHLLPPDSASERILQYLIRKVGKKVQREVIDVVAAISEYSRRIREWRVEFGFPIQWKKGGDAYILHSKEPDAEKAEKWRTMNKIKRLQIADKKVGDKKKALALFQAYPNQVLTTAQLKYVMASGEMRRIRDLRLEDGWRIFTRNTGRPDLKDKQYILVDPEQLLEHDRQVKDEVYSQVLKRDGHRCQKVGCGWHPTDKIAGDRKQYIEVHHKTWHSQKGENNLNNLITLCNVHHRDVHRRKIGPDQLAEWLESRA